MTENGDLLIFDNRREFIAPRYDDRLGDVDELDNGNVLACTGGGNDQTAYLSEVAPDGALVWEIVVDDEVYRAERIAWEDFR